jgi:hypothetical protein
MTPSKEPTGDAPESAPARSDPAAELARKYVEAGIEFDAREGVTDEEIETFDKDVARPLEAELMGAVPTTREGVVALLDAVLYLELDNIDHEIEKEPSLDLLELRLVENIRDAVKAGVGD